MNRSHFLSHNHDNIIVTVLASPKDATEGFQLVF